MKFNYKQPVEYHLSQFTRGNQERLVHFVVTKELLLTLNRIVINNRFFLLCNMSNGNDYYTSEITDNY
jgi:hypothetical protein